MTKATTASINAALKKAGIQAEFCHNRGDGYSYFIGPDVEYAETTSVYCCYIYQLTIEQWVNEALAFKKESTERKAQLEQSNADCTFKLRRIHQ